VRLSNPRLCQAVSTAQDIPDCVFTGNFSARFTRLMTLFALIGLGRRGADGVFIIVVTTWGLFGGVLNLKITISLNCRHSQLEKNIIVK
jgi:hypothetical protein